MTGPASKAGTISPMVITQNPGEEANTNQADERFDFTQKPKPDEIIFKDGRYFWGDGRIINRKERRALTKQLSRSK